MLLQAALRLVPHGGGGENVVFFFFFNPFQEAVQRFAKLLVPSAMPALPYESDRTGES